MVTETTSEKGSSTTAKTSLGIGIGALGLLLLQNGAFGGILGGRPTGGEPPWGRDLSYERQLTQADAKIGKLESQLYTDQQVNGLRQELQGATAALAVFNATLNGTVAAINAQTKQLMGMTGLIINGPAMAASEAAASAFTAKAASETSNG